MTSSDDGMAKYRQRFIGGHVMGKILREQMVLSPSLAVIGLSTLLVMGCATPLENAKAPSSVVSGSANASAEVKDSAPVHVLLERDASPTAQADLQRSREANVTAGPPAHGDIQKATNRTYAEPRSLTITDSLGQERVDLSFNDTPIPTVVRSVLGDALGLRFVIDPDVRGSITLQSSGPITKRQLLGALESALRLVDVAMMPGADGTVRIVPLRKADGFATSVSGPYSKPLPGYGLEIVPLRHASASELQETIKPLLPNGVLRRVDSARNLLIVAGTSAERQAIVDLVRVFDTNVANAISVGVFPLANVEPEDMIAELQRVLRTTNAGQAPQVELVPLPRIGAVLAASPFHERLDHLQEWIRKLDVQRPMPGRRIHVYEARHVSAGELATAIAPLFGGETGESTSRSRPTPTNQSAGSSAGTSATAIAVGDLRIIPNESTNSILIFADGAEFESIESVLKQLDAPPRQVLIEATLAEVTLNDQLRFGIQWFFESGGGSLALSQSGSAAPSSEFPGFSFVYAGSARVDAVLNALESITQVKVVSSPKLMVINNREASLQVGDQVPVVSQSTVSVGNPGAPIVNSVQMRDTGVILRVTPRVNEGGMVTLDVAQEVSDVTPTTTSGIDSPTIQQRRLNSTVAVRSGQTIALGGLIRESSNDNRSGLPWLQRIPFFGRLFGATDVGNRRTELIILITPYVIQDLNETQELGERLRNAFDALRPQIDELR